MWGQSHVRWRAGGGTCVRCPQHPHQVGRVPAAPVAPPPFTCTSSAHNHPHIRRNAAPAKQLTIHKERGSRQPELAGPPGSAAAAAADASAAPVPSAAPSVASASRTAHARQMFMGRARIRVAHAAGRRGRARGGGAWPLGSPVLRTWVVELLAVLAVIFFPPAEAFFDHGEAEYGPHAPPWEYGGAGRSNPFASRPPHRHGGPGLRAERDAHAHVVHGLHGRATHHPAPPQHGARGVQDVCLPPQLPHRAARRARAATPRCARCAPQRTLSVIHLRRRRSPDIGTAWWTAARCRAVRAPPRS